METIISFLKRRWWSFVPLMVCIGVWLSIWMVFGVDYQEDNLLFDLADLTLLSIPGSFSLLFVRKSTVVKWSIFAVVYFLLSFFILNQSDPSSRMFGSERAWNSFSLGILFSIITIFWSIIHTLILRHRDKKNMGK
jgi:hypothetical protein